MAVIVTYEIYQNIHKIEKLLNRQEIATAPIYTSVKPDIPPKNQGNVVKGKC